MDIKITKRDGSEESFDKNKVTRVVKAAGLPEDEANDLAQNLQKWMDAQKDQKITSLQIRDQVLLLLKEKDEYAANMFEWYQKTKDPASQ